MTEAVPKPGFMWKTTGPLFFRSWNEEFIVYHNLSGDTHLLGPAAAHILLQLQKAPSDTLRLCETCAQQMNLRTDDEFCLEINKILANLHSLLLIEPTPF